jgi:putative transposase
MKLNEFGYIVSDEWCKSTNIRHEIELDTFIVMPNHIHGIVRLRNPNVGATGWSPFPAGPHKHSLGAFIAGFKAAIAKRINKARGSSGASIWQRNYYDHVIRDEESLNRIREYIVNNRAQWSVDPENLAVGNIHDILQLHGWRGDKGDQPVAPTKDLRNT